MAPGVKQSDGRTKTGLPLSKANSRTLRWAAIEAAQRAWRESKAWHQLYSDICKRRDNNDATSAIARKILTAACPRTAVQAKPPGGGNSTVPASSISVLAA
jgi:hypothetical protein